MATKALSRGHSINNREELTGEPICQPFKTFESVEEWIPGHDEVCRATDRLFMKGPEKVGQPQHPRTLVCHDMKGGYVEDRFVQGVVEKDAYRFYHWSGIDQFIYFSHYFVTIPPPGWTNVAHKHGVPMMGTIITEWDDGKKRCDALLSSPEKYVTIAQILAQMAAYYKFDGWLINIENPIAPEKVPSLVDFVRVLTEEMHRVIPHSIVIWYDSVIHTGELKWQNELNDKNRCFFDVCDGIFLNYTWKDGSLERSLQCVEDSGRSVFDVYVGVDVFGRGCRGGGGFNTKEAMEVIRQHYLSAAIFAQGWVWEKFENDNFSAQENRFWALLEPYLTHHPATTWPICSDFNQGWGQKTFHEGKEVAALKWGDIGLQSLQPTWQPVAPVDDTDRGNDDTLKSSLPYHFYTADSYSGGGCLRMVRTGTHKLYDVSAILPEDLTVTYTTKSTGNSSIQLILRTESQESLTLGNNSEYQAQEINGWTKRTYRVDSWSGKQLSCVQVKAEVDEESPLLGEIQIMQNSQCSQPKLTVSQEAIVPSDGDKKTSSIRWTLIWDDISLDQLDSYQLFYRYPGSGNDEDRYLGSTSACVYIANNLTDTSDRQVEFILKAKLRTQKVVELDSQTTSYKI